MGSVFLVPVLTPHGHLTLIEDRDASAVQAGDECLVIFADYCIDAWWQSRGTGNVQLDKRRHDLSDGFALIGPWSQPHKIASYSTSAAELRSLDGTVKLAISGSQVTITAPGGVVVSNDLLVQGNLTVNGNIDSKNVLLHEHTGVTTGSGHTGPVL
jgi:Phage protein Gp138 N-terminal domain